MQLVMLCLPALAVLFFFAFKIPPKAKDAFFRIPIWISSTVLAFLVGHLMLSGVMATYAALMMDVVLMPGLWAIKKSREGSSSVANAVSKIRNRLFGRRSAQPAAA